MIERFRLFGDRRKAAQWLPFARKRIAWWKRQGRPGVWSHKWWVPGGEVRVIVDRVAQSEWIWIRIEEGTFWWWTYFFGFAADSTRIAQVVAADVPGKIGEPDGPSDLRGLYKYQQIFNGTRWLGGKTPQISKVGKQLVTALYEVHDDMTLNEFHVKLGTVFDRDRPQEPTFFFDYTIALDPDAPVFGAARLGPAVYPFLYAEEWALLIGNYIGGPAASGATLVRGRYPTPDNDTTFLAQIDNISLDSFSVANLTTLPGPNPGAGTSLRTVSTSRIGFGYWQGNGSFDPLIPPPAPKNRDFYFVALVDTVDAIPGSSPAQYQQAAVLFKRSIENPGVNAMVTSWLLAEHIQTGGNQNVGLFSVYEYQGKLFVIFGRYVKHAPDDAFNLDRDWFFDQYVVNKDTGVLLHTQLDCGIRMWVETDKSLYGYAMPTVTYAYSGFTPTAANIQWKLREYAFGTGDSALSLFPVEDSLGNPVDLLSITTTIPLYSVASADRAHDYFNNLVLLQH